MNKEIKEILNNLKNKDNDIKGINFLKYQDLTRGEINLLLDYISNLKLDIEQSQEILADYKEELEEEKRINKANLKLIDKLEEENHELKSKLECYENGVYYSSEVDKLEEENESLKELSYNIQDEYNKLFNHLIIDKPRERINKAIEYIKKDTKWFDSEYASIYGKLCDCAGAKNDRLEVMVNPSNLLKILQNGDGE